MDTGLLSSQPKCHRPGCGRAATFKVAAEWISGEYRELKSYGLYCGDCVGGQLAPTRSKVAALRCAEGESIGQVGVYRLVPGVRDGKLPHVPELEHA